MGSLGEGFGGGGGFFLDTEGLVMFLSLVLEYRDSISKTVTLN